MTQHSCVPAARLAVGRVAGTAVALRWILMLAIVQESHCQRRRAVYQIPFLELGKSKVSFLFFFPPAAALISSPFLICAPASDVPLQAVLRSGFLARC